MKLFFRFDKWSPFFILLLLTNFICSFFSELIRPQRATSSSYSLNKLKTHSYWLPVDKKNDPPFFLFSAISFFPFCFKKIKESSIYVNGIHENEKKEDTEMVSRSSILFTMRTPLLGLPSWTPNVHAAVVIYDINSETNLTIQGKMIIGSEAKKFHIDKNRDEGNRIVEVDDTDENISKRSDLLLSSLPSSIDMSNQVLASEGCYQLFPVNIVDFIPINATSFKTLFTLLSGKAVPGQIRIRKTYFFISEDQYQRLDAVKKLSLDSLNSNREIHSASSITGFLCSKNCKELGNDSVKTDHSADVSYLLMESKCKVENQGEGLESELELSNIKMIDKDNCFPVTLKTIGLSKRTIKERNHFLKDNFFTSLSLIKNNCYTFEERFLEFLFYRE